MEPDDLPCSRNARPPKALVERAQWKINQAPSLKRIRASLEERRGAARCPSYSRNAHDQNVLVRRPQSGLTRVPFQTWANEQAWREQLYRSMRAVKDGLPTPSEGGGESGGSRSSHAIENRLATSVWLVSQVPPVAHISRQRNYARSKGQPWPRPPRCIENWKTPLGIRSQG